MRHKRYRLLACERDGDECGTVHDLGEVDGRRSNARIQRTLRAKGLVPTGTNSIERLDADTAGAALGMNEATIIAAVTPGGKARAEPDGNTEA